ncbi:1177_t:CDS:2, partial [Dentiscutata heterogama]
IKNGYKRYLIEKLINSILCLIFLTTVLLKNRNLKEWLFTTRKPEQEY